jgi:3-hydroxybutyryl-CoA dehydrogenase
MNTIAVIGGGMMGAGIAQVFAVAGFPVIVFEPDTGTRNSVHMRVAATLEMAGNDQSSLQHISIASDLADAVAGAAYVTEAVPENLELKQSIFADLVQIAPRDCILASNTSVIPIARIAHGLDTADRIVGTHWWNPPDLVPLVEVVQAAQTSDATIATTMALLQNVGKSPAHIERDTPGFVANRLQHALWREAIAMVAEGICDAETLDTCVKNSFGLRLPVLGPLENADMVGLDLTLAIHQTMIPELDRHAKPHAYLESKVADGRLGFKTGEGFRRWTTDEKQALRKSLANHLVAAQRSRMAA